MVETIKKILFGCAAVGVVLSNGAVMAASSTVSASSDAGSSLSNSINSASNSLGESSHSSTNDGARAGAHQITEVAAVSAKPGMVRLTLRAVEPTTETKPLLLTLPRTTFDRAGLANGEWVDVRLRDYGIEFATLRTGQAFFLVLDDDWHRELRTVPVGL